ncbi:CGGC domain-containing protein [Clostridium sp. CF011]|uniref:CGGC domain-containing protein n=1 Tax=Clostridium sp. CF011 TaxID=2843318 RepID=UPI001C0E62FF|nr:CGGC domain-containing protein [Clostridium sp. CF011]MBU3092237.1 CGGC domain-containing protein [Clostridium sp. CF011]WAG70292.1 CGGC domain-containing protein [Clostridium sp. CF011]
MKKIAVLRCFKVSSKCSGSGCIKAFNNKTASFNDYDASLDMVMQIPCSGCNAGSLKEMLNSSEELKKQGVSSIHLSTCIRATCPYYNEFVKGLSKEFEVVGYTHGRKK